MTKHNIILCGTGSLGWYDFHTRPAQSFSYHFRALKFKMKFSSEKFETVLQPDATFQTKGNHLFPLVYMVYLHE